MLGRYSLIKGMFSRQKRGLGAEEGLSFKLLDNPLHSDLSYTCFYFVFIHVTARLRCACGSPNKMSSNRFNLLRKIF